LEEGKKSLNIFAERQENFKKQMAAGTKYIASHRRIIAKALLLLCCFHKLPLPFGYAGRSAETKKRLSKWRQG